MKKIITFLLFFVFGVNGGEVNAGNSHVHTDSCYNGTKHIHEGDSSTKGGCYQGEGTPIYGSCTGTCTSWYQYYCKDCTSYYAGASTCQQCGSSNTNCWPNYSCSTCGFSSSINSGHNSIINGYTYELNCGKEEGVYYNGNVNVTNAPQCATIVKSIAACEASQTINKPDSFNTRVIVTYLDNTTSQVTATSNFNTSLLNEIEKSLEEYNDNKVLALQYVDELKMTGTLTNEEIELLKAHYFESITQMETCIERINFLLDKYELLWEQLENYNSKSEPDNKKDSTTENTTKPKDNSNNHNVIWMIVVLIAAAGLIFVIIYFWQKRKYYAE